MASFRMRMTCRCKPGNFGIVSMRAASAERRLRGARGFEIIAVHLFCDLIEGPHASAKQGHQRRLLGSN